MSPRAADVQIHPTAVVAASARLGRGVTIGPYAVVGDAVVLGDGVRLGPHTVVEGPTGLGEGCEVFPFASVGTAAQHRHTSVSATRLVVGRRTVIREYVTLNRGTEEGGGVTVVGDDNLLMAYAHVAHDCRLGDGVVLSNGATLAGHVEVGDGAVLSGLCAVHQFARLGRLCFVAGGAMVARDVPPFCRVAGDRARLAGLNLVGLERAGLGGASLSALKEAFRALFRSEDTAQEACRRLLSGGPSSPEVAELIAFVESSQRGICGGSADGA